MKNFMNIKISAIVLIICMLLCTMAGCKQDTTVLEQRIQDFAVKCNELDIDGMLRCLDPSVSEPIALTISGIEMVAKLSGSPVDKYELFSAVSDVILDSEGINGMDFFKSIEVEVDHIDVEENVAYAYCYISYVISDIKFKKEAVIYMIEQADIWYVQDLEFCTFE